MSHYGFPNLTDEFQVWVKGWDVLPYEILDLILLECDTRADLGQTEDQLMDYVRDFVAFTFGSSRAVRS